MNEKEKLESDLSGSQITGEFTLDLKPFDNVEIQVMIQYCIFFNPSEKEVEINTEWVDTIQLLVIGTTINPNDIMNWISHYSELYKINAKQLIEKAIAQKIEENEIFKNPTLTNFKNLLTDLNKEPEKKVNKFDQLLNDLFGPLNKSISTKDLDEAFTTAEINDHPFTPAEEISRLQSEGWKIEINSELELGEWISRYN